MNKNIFLVFVILILSFPSIVISSPEKDIKDTNVVLQKIELSLQKAETEISYIKTNQLNYQIEKNLLKEAYSSNLETLNIILAIILGALTIIGFIIGFIGFKDIREIKENFKIELNNLQELHKQFESKILNTF